MHLFSRSKIPLICAGLFLFVLLFYTRATGYGFVSFDDETFVLQNPLIRHLSWQSVVRLFTRFYPDEYLPLTLLSYSMEYALFGLDPFFYHLDNILLHAANTVLVFFLLLQWSGKNIAAFVGALFFAIHPLTVETVVWISARKDLLCAFFFLLSFLAYGQYGRRYRKRWYGISIGLFLLALLSKLLAVSLPLVILLQDYRSGRSLKASIVSALPFLALSVFFGVVGLLGKAPHVGDLPSLSFLALGTKAILHTFEKIIFPVHLSIVYPQLTPPDPLSFDLFFPMAIVGLVLSLCVHLAGTRSPMILLLSGFFLATLAPVFFVLRRASGLYFGEDKFAYLPVIAVACALGWMFWFLWQKKQWRFSVPFLFLLLFGVFGFLSLQRMPVWENDTTLFSDAVERNPDWPLVQYAL